MAPPRSRRPGYSRKAQYGLFLGYVAAVTGALLALLLIVAAMFDPQGFGALRARISDLTAPASSAGRSTIRGTGSVGDWISNYVNAGSQNAALRAELEAAKRKLRESGSIAYENQRLRDLLQLVRSDRQPVAVARLVSSSATSARRFAVLNAGQGDGVRPGLPVRSVDGLVGRVAAVGGSTSWVTLLTDGSMVIPVRRARDGLPAAATGMGDGGLDIRPLIMGDNPFKPGDVLVTSGAGGVYPPDVPVAVVIRPTSDGALGRPLAHPATLDFAIVEPMYQPAAAAPMPEPAQ